MSARIKRMNRAIEKVAFKQSGLPKPGSVDEYIAKAEAKSKLDSYLKEPFTAENNPAGILRSQAAESRNQWAENSLAARKNMPEVEGGFLSRVGNLIGDNKAAVGAIGGGAAMLMVAEIMRRRRNKKKMQKTAFDWNIAPDMEKAYRDVNKKGPSRPTKVSKFYIPAPTPAPAPAKSTKSRVGVPKYTNTWEQLPSTILDGLRRKVEASRNWVLKQPVLLRNALDPLAVPTDRRGLYDPASGLSKQGWPIKKRVSPEEHSVKTDPNWR